MGEGVGDMNRCMSKTHAALYIVPNMFGTQMFEVAGLKMKLYHHIKPINQINWSDRKLFVFALLHRSYLHGQSRCYDFLWLKCGIKYRGNNTIL